VGFHCDWLKDIRVGEAPIFRLFIIIIIIII